MDRVQTTTQSAFGAQKPQTSTQRAYFHDQNIENKGRQIDAVRRKLAGMKIGNITK